MSQSGRLGMGGSGTTPTSPLRVISDFDDFLSTGIANVNPKLGWNSGYLQFEGTADNPGIIYGNAGLTTHNSTDLVDAANFMLGSGELSINWVLDLGTLSDVTNRYVFRVGVSNFDVTDFANPTDGCYFEYSDNVNSGNWQLVCISGGVATTTNTAIPATTGFHGFAVNINAAGTSVVFYYDGVESGTISTNIPLTVAISPFVLSENISGLNPFHYIDLFYYRQVLTNPRPGFQPTSI